MEYRVLGPIEVMDGEGLVPLGGPHQRGVLALLLLHAGHVVPTGAFIDALWGDDPPITAAKVVQNNVSHLRKLLKRENCEVILTRAPGYRIELDIDELDLDRFLELTAVGRNALAEHNFAEALEQLVDALALWRGPALLDLTLTPFPREEIAMLDELRLVSQIDLFDAALAVGRDAELVPEIEGLVREHPFEERLRGQLVLALYRSGRQADALAAYQDDRRFMAAELGIQPGTPLKELEAAILRQDAGLDASVEGRSHARERGPPGSRRRTLAAAVIASVLAALAATAIVAALMGGNGGDHATVAIARNQVARIEPRTASLSAQLSVGTRPFALASGDAGVWVATHGRTVERVTGSGTEPTRRVVLPSQPGGVAVGFGSAWATEEFTGVLDRVSPRGALVARIHLGGAPGAVVAGAGGVWIADAAAGSLVRVDPDTNRVTNRITAAEEPTDVTLGGGTLWVADRARRAVVPIDPVARRAGRPIRLAFAPSQIAFGGRRLWVTGTSSDSASAVDPATRTAAITIKGIGRAPRGITVADGWVWVANSRDNVIARVNPHTGNVAERIRTGTSPDDLIFARGGLWVTTHAP